MCRSLSEDPTNTRGTHPQIVANWGDRACCELDLLCSADRQEHYAQQARAVIHQVGYSKETNSIAKLPIKRPDSQPVLLHK